MRNLMIAAAVIAFSLAGCGSSEESNSATADGYTGYSSYAAYDEDSDEADEERGEFDEDTAREDAIAELDGLGYQDLNGNYGCTDDCGGHDAGFAWAQENDVTDGGVYTPSQSFDEGAEAYSEAIEDRVEEMRSDYENGDTEYESQY